MLPKYAIKWGDVWRKNPWNKGTFTENVVHKPTFMAYELRLLWRTNPDFYPIWAVFIGGGGGLQYIETMATSAFISGSSGHHIYSTFSAVADRSATTQLQIKMSHQISAPVVAVSPWAGADLKFLQIQASECKSYVSKIFCLHGTIGSGITTGLMLKTI